MESKTALMEETRRIAPVRNSAKHRAQCCCSVHVGTPMQMVTCMSCVSLQYCLLQNCLKDADQANISAKVAFAFQLTGGVTETETVFMQMMKTAVITVGHYSVLSLCCIPHPLYNELIQLLKDIYTNLFPTDVSCKQTIALRLSSCATLLDAASAKIGSAMGSATAMTSQMNLHLAVCGQTHRQLYVAGCHCVYLFIKPIHHFVHLYCNFEVFSYSMRTVPGAL